MNKQYYTNCKYSIRKDKKFKSYGELLEDRKVCERLEKLNSCNKYYDTQEKLACYKASAKYNNQIIVKS